MLTLYMPGGSDPGNTSSVTDIQLIRDDHVGAFTKSLPLPVHCTLGSKPCLRQCVQWCLQCAQKKLLLCL